MPIRRAPVVLSALLALAACVRTSSGTAPPGSGDEAATDVAAGEVVSSDTSWPDTVDPDTEGADTAAPDTAPPDTTAPDTTETDAPETDTGTPSPCGGIDPPALRDCVDQSRYATDLAFIAAPRPPGSPHWQAVQDLCHDRFVELGYEVERQDYGSGVNVVGVRPGLAHPGQHVVVSAHYDHIAGCDGADDNGSGVAGVLEAARVLATAPHARTLVVACWDEEELGLIGSLSYASDADAVGADIVASYVFEMIGYKSDAPDSQKLPGGFDLLFPEPWEAIDANGWRGDFVAMVSDTPLFPSAERIVAHAQAVGLPAYAIELTEDLMGFPGINDLFRSDHAAFWSFGYPAMMITDTANFRNENYHCSAGPDSFERLDMAYAAQVVAATVGAAAEMLAVE